MWVFSLSGVLRQKIRLKPSPQKSPDSAPQTSELSNQKKHETTLVFGNKKSFSRVLDLPLKINAALSGFTVLKCFFELLY